MSFETPEALASELKLTTENDGSLYRAQILPMIKSLVAKKASGKYDREKAITLFMHLAEAGARTYAKTFGTGESEWHTIFPIEVRRIAATEWRDEFEMNFKDGEYDEYIPKKYQKTITKTSTPLGKEYTAGMELAQKTAGGLSQTEIQSIVDEQHVYGGTRKKYSTAFTQGYLSRMVAILMAMQGN